MGTTVNVGSRDKISQDDCQQNLLAVLIVFLELRSAQRRDSYEY